MRLRWRHTNPETGGNVSVETMDFVRFENDRLAEHWGARLSYEET